MARHGVTYPEVAQAATQLTAQGKIPTIEQIRLILGTGSSTTLSNHLRQWKQNQNATDKVALKENIPPEFISMMKGLWERMVNQSDEQVSAIKNDFQTSTIELHQELKKYKHNNQRWQKLFNHWVQEKSQLENENSMLEQVLEAKKYECATLAAKQDTLLKQLQEKQEYIEELQRLNKQTQENFERLQQTIEHQLTQAFSRQEKKTETV